MGASESTVAVDYGTYDPRPVKVEDDTTFGFCCEQRVRHKWGHDAVQWTQDDEMLSHRSISQQGVIVKHSHDPELLTVRGETTKQAAPSFPHAGGSTAHTSGSDDVAGQRALSASTASAVPPYTSRSVGSLSDFWEPPVSMPAVPTPRGNESISSHVTYRYSSSSTAAIPPKIKPGPERPVSSIFDLVDTIYHVCPFAQYAECIGYSFYKGDLFLTEGYIRCASYKQALKVADFLPADNRGWVLLRIDSSLIKSSVTFQKLYTSTVESLNPHIVGPLNLSAVKKVYPVEASLLIQQVVRPCDIIKMAHASFPDSNFDAVYFGPSSFYLPKY